MEVGNYKFSPLLVSIFQLLLVGKTLMERGWNNKPIYFLMTLDSFWKDRCLKKQKTGLDDPLHPIPKFFEKQQIQKEGAKPELSFIIKHCTSILHMHLSPYTHLLQKHGEIKPELWNWRSASRWWEETVPSGRWFLSVPHILLPWKLIYTTSAIYEFITIHYLFSVFTRSIFVFTYTMLPI